MRVLCPCLLVTPWWFLCCLGLSPAQFDGALRHGACSARQMITSDVLPLRDYQATVCKDVCDQLQKSTPARSRPFLIGMLSFMSQSHAVRKNTSQHQKQASSSSGEVCTACYQQEYHRFVADWVRQDTDCSQSCRTSAQNQIVGVWGDVQWRSMEDKG